MSIPVSCFDWPMVIIGPTVKANAINVMLLMELLFHIRLSTLLYQIIDIKSRVKQRWQIKPNTNQMYM